MGLSIIGVNLEIVQRAVVSESRREIVPVIILHRYMVVQIVQHLEIILNTGIVVSLHVQVVMYISC